MILMLMFCHIPDLVMNYDVCVLIIYYVYLTRYIYRLILVLLLALVMSSVVSWLDHVLSTISGHSLFTNISVKSDFITSDHCSLCFVFQLIICMYRYHHLTVHHATNLIITGTEHPMSICLIIIHTPELNLQKSSCLLMHYSVKM